MPRAYQHRARTSPDNPCNRCDPRDSQLACCGLGWSGRATATHSAMAASRFAYSANWACVKEVLPMRCALDHQQKPALPQDDARPWRDRSAAILKG